MKMNITIRITTAVLLLILALTLPAAASDYTLEIFGNANEDDTINMQDVTYTELIILEYRDETELSDAKHDGKINMQDVTQIELVILGKEKELTLIDAADRVVTISKPVEKIVTTFSFEESIAVDGEDIFEKIVGWNRDYWEGRRQWIWDAYVKAFPEMDDIPDVGYPSKGTFNVEKVITLDPDVVITSTVELKHAETAVTQLEQAGIPTVFVDYHSETIEMHRASTLTLGYVFDERERAQEIVEFYTEQVNKMYSRLEEIDEPKPTVYVECGYTGPSEYSNTYGDFMWGALIESCGGINIAEGVVEKSGPINPEYLLDADPDVIIITGSYWPANPGSMRLGYYADREESRELLLAFTERPGWDTLNAVNENRVYSVQHGLSRHIYDFVAVQYFAKCMYPGEFEDIDPEDGWKEFHERFLPVDYSGVWMLSLAE